MEEGNMEGNVEEIVEMEEKGGEVEVKKEEGKEVPPVEFEITRDALVEFINLASVGGLIDELRFTVSEKGLIATNVDLSRVMLSVAILPSDYLLNPAQQTRQLCIEAGEVSKLLAHVKDEDVKIKVTKDKMTLKTKTMRIKAPILSYGKQEDFSKLIKITDDLKVETQFNHDFEYEVQVSELKNALIMKDADVVFGCYEGGVTITQYGVQGEYETTTILNFAEGEPAHKVILSYEYLRKILSVCNKDNLVICKLSKETNPAVFSYTGENGVDAIYLLAPKLEM